VPEDITLLTDIARVVKSAFGGQEKTASTSGSGAITIDLADGNAQTVTLTGDAQLSLVGSVPGRACSVVLRVRQDASGGHALDFPLNVLWPSNIVPSVSGAPEALDKFVFETVDGGLTWEGNVAGQGYA
jgi:hypothetical protein